MKKIIAFSVFMVAVCVGASAQIERKIDTTKRAKIMQHQNAKKSMLKSVKLTDDQKEQLKADSEANKAAIENIKNDVSLSEEQKQSKIKTLQAAQKEKMKTLLTPEQKKQIAANKENVEKLEKAEQMKGNRKEMYKNLNLSEEQKVKMKEQQTETRAKLKSIQNNTSLTEDQKKEERRAVLKSANDQQKTILNADQQRQMKEMRKQHKRDGKMRRKPMQATK